MLYAGALIGPKSGSQLTTTITTLRPYGRNPCPWYLLRQQVEGEGDFDAPLHRSQQRHCPGSCKHRQSVYICSCLKYELYLNIPSQDHLLLSAGALVCSKRANDRLNDLKYQPGQLHCPWTSDIYIERLECCILSMQPASHGAAITSSDSLVR